MAAPAATTATPAVETRTLATPVRWELPVVHLEDYYERPVTYTLSENHGTVVVPALYPVHPTIIHSQTSPPITSSTSVSTLITSTIATYTTGVTAFISPTAYNTKPSTTSSTSSALFNGIVNYSTATLPTTVNGYTSRYTVTIAAVTPTGFFDAYAPTTTVTIMPVTTAVVTILPATGTPYVSTSTGYVTLDGSGGEGNGSYRIGMPRVSGVVMESGAGRGYSATAEWADAYDLAVGVAVFALFCVAVAGLPAMKLVWSVWFYWY
ncbi:hypothetical protein Dda_1522 [Drechslerella dactyloides]|uniref:Uncharacterized protein n=1 Tax=Drechslerella dactyloides TaxID=74499 RepID=A0AAD6J1V7_DREDA|nr:hypothetical protein Dda_1522 [Drechslerella dactyloides]